MSTFNLLAYFSHFSNTIIMHYHNFLKTKINQNVKIDPNRYILNELNSSTFKTY